MDYCAHIVILMAIYVILAVSLDLMAGYTGMLSMAHAAYFGIGAYGYALLCSKFTPQFPFVAACVVSIAAVAGLILGFSSIRVRSDYFAISSLSIQIVLASIFLNCTSLTGGPMGIADVHPMQIGRWVAAKRSDYLFVVLVSTAIVYSLSSFVVSRRFGLVLRAIRQDEMFVESLGVSVASNKLWVSCVSAAMAAFAGCLYASYTSYIDPSSFSVNESIGIVAAVICGGRGTLVGPALGSMFFVAAPEALRFLGLPAGTAANLRQLLFGFLLVVVMLLRPRGLLGNVEMEG